MSSTCCIRLTLPLELTFAEAHGVLIPCLMSIAPSNASVAAKRICNVSSLMRTCVRLLPVSDFPFILSLRWLAELPNVSQDKTSGPIGKSGISKLQRVPCKTKFWLVCKGCAATDFRMSGGPCRAVVSVLRSKKYQTLGGGHEHANCRSCFSSSGRCSGVLAWCPALPDWCGRGWAFRGEVVLQKTCPSVFLRRVDAVSWLSTICRKPDSEKPCGHCRRKTCNMIDCRYML